MKELSVMQMKEIEGGLQIMCGVAVAWSGFRIGGMLGSIGGVAAGALDCFT